MSKVKQLKQLGTAMSCVLSHEVSKTEHNFKWAGGTLNAIWPDILAFFRWTQETYRSESQVRLFYNVRTNEWSAWAFPQRAKTGMSAHELVETDKGYEKTVEQRARYKDEDGWVYWGTVHHHCDSGAFQSPADENNEQSQDGLHITMGKVTSERMDMHSRVYLSGMKLSGVSMADFWDLTEFDKSIPDDIVPLLKENAWEMEAVRQMTTPPPKDHVFPQQWKDNIIDLNPPRQEVQVHTRTFQQHSTVIGGSSFYTGEPFVRRFSQRSSRAFDYDLNRAAYCMASWCQEPENTGDFPTGLMDAMKILKQLGKMLNPKQLNVLDLCMTCDVQPNDLHDHMLKLMAESKSSKEPQTRGQVKVTQILTPQQKWEEQQRLLSQQ